MEAQGSCAKELSLALTPSGTGEGTALPPRADFPYRFRVPQRRFGNLASIITSPRILVAMLLMVGGAYVFLQILDEVREGEFQHFDDLVLKLLRDTNRPSAPIGPDWLHEMGRDATALGGVLCITLITLFVVIFLLLERKRRAAMFLVIAIGGGAIMSGILKHLIARDRPEIVPHLSAVYTSSFPSGHSMLSAVAYLTMGTLLARITARRSTKLFLIFAAIFLTAIVGISRVYMGVHYPTDVLGGWAAGLTWAIICWMVATILQRQGTIEREDSGVQQEGYL